MLPNTTPVTVQLLAVPVNKEESNRQQYNTKTHPCHLLQLTYTGLFEGNGGKGFPQGIDCCHVNFVGETGEDLSKLYVAAVLVDRVFLHLQRMLFMSEE